MRWIKQLFPALEWIPGYKKSLLRGDISAGITVAVMLIPQSMAYAMLAGLPPIIGLYSATVPLIIYAFFGTSRQMAVGPVAMVSLLVASGIGSLGITDPTQHIKLAIELSLLVGAIQLIMGMARVGFLTNFLSHPIVSGFSSAAALIIGFSQLKHILGVNLPRSNDIYQITKSTIVQFSSIHLATFFLGIGSILILLLLKRYKPMLPGALVVVILSSLIVWGFQLDSEGVSIVGAVPVGLPGIAIPQIDPEYFPRLFPIALTIAFIGFMESIAIAKKMASEKHYEVQPNQELIALGLSNIMGSLFRSYPVTGGLSRTAVNAQAGANTGLASIITVIMVGITLLFLTPLFYYLPDAVLASIIIVASLSLVDIEEVIRLWKIKKSDLAILGLTFLTTLILGIEQGIIIGVVSSLLLFVVKTTQPHFAVLGRIPNTTDYRNILRYPDAEQFPELLLLRIDAQFYYGNVTFLKEKLSRLEKQRRNPLGAVIIDASSINNLDSSADMALHEILFDYSKRHIQLYFANVKGPVMDIMKKSRFYDRLGEDHFFLNVHSAVEYVRKQYMNDE